MMCIYILNVSICLWIRTYVYFYIIYMNMHTYVKKTYNLLEALWISVGASQICRFFLVVQERAL